MKKLIFIYISLIVLLYFRIIDLDRWLNKDNHQEDYIKNKAIELREISKIEKESFAFCENKYFPLVKDSFFSYQVVKDYNFKQKEKITFIVPDYKDSPSFNVEIFYDHLGISKMSNFECLKNGLTVNNLDFLLYQPNENQEITITKKEGIFLPKSFNSNDSWDLYLEIKHSAGENKDLVNKNNINYDYMNEEFDLKFKDNGNEEIELFFGKVWTKKVGIVWSVNREYFKIKHRREIEEGLETYQLEGQDKAEGLVEQKVDSLNESFFCNLWLGERMGILKSHCETKERNSIILEVTNISIPPI